MNTYPEVFYFVVDDAGFAHVRPDGKGPTIGFDAYENLLTLAEEFQLRIPLCFTVKFIDLNNISGIAEPVSYADKLIGFLKDNEQYFEVANHGLTHEFRGSYYEFFNPHTGEELPTSIQEERAGISAEIWNSLGFPFPTIFVPPAHGWQPGVTDRVYADLGTEYLISLPQEKTTIEALTGFYRLNIWRLLKPVFQWHGSRFLLFLPRSSMGLGSIHLNISKLRSSFVMEVLNPDRRWAKALLQRRVKPWRPHSYMTHIGNFMGYENLIFWRKLLKWVESRPGLCLAHDNEEAIRLWKSLPRLQEGNVSEVSS